MLHLYRFRTYKSNLNYTDCYRVISAEDIKLKLKKSIDELNQLQVLDLFYNQLTSIPGEVGNPIQLRRFILYNNQLTSIPEIIHKSLYSRSYLSLAESHFLVSGIQIFLI